MSFTQDYVSDTHKFILVWSPKVASTSLHDWFIRDLCRIQVKGDPRTIAQKHNISRYITDYSRYKGYNVIMFTRDPIERCISAYINKFVKNKRGKINNVKDIESFALQLISSFDASLLKNYSGISFIQFLNAIEYGLASENIDVHFRPQICPTRLKNIMNHCSFRMYDMEDVSSVITSLNKKYDIPNRKKVKQNATMYNTQPISNTDISHIKSLQIDATQICFSRFRSQFTRMNNIFNEDNIYRQRYIFSDKPQRRTRVVVQRSHLYAP